MSSRVSLSADFAIRAQLRSFVTLLLCAGTGLVGLYSIEKKSFAGMPTSYTGQQLLAFRSYENVTVSLKSKTEIQPSSVGNATVPLPPSVDRQCLQFIRVIICH